MASPSRNLFGAAFALALLAGCSGSGGPRPRSDVLLVIVDTLRADALGCYGSSTGASPVLDAFAAHCVRFETCLAQAPNTATSHATLFTGLHPWSHRVANLTSLERGTPGLPPVFETLAERFAAAGYRTAAITDGGPLGRIWNLCQGFETLEASYEGVEAKLDRALAFLHGAGDDRPLFLLVHTYEVHLPYAAPEEWTERFAGGYEGPLASALADIRASRAAGGETQPDGKRMLRDRDSFTDRDWEELRHLYDAEVAFTDHELARLLSETEPGGRLEHAIVAVTSDHGEEFGEHGEWGHHQLHVETLRVPLLLRLPGGAGSGRAIAEPVGLIDLHATLLEAAGLGVPERIDSRSLLPLVRGERRAELPLFAETTEHLYAERTVPWLRAVRLGDSVYLSELPRPDEPASEIEELYARGEDPAETRDLLAPERVDSRARSRARQGRELLGAHLQGAVDRRLELLDGRPASWVRPPDEELARELRALGYADD